ncbi:MAG: MotA/TolQ/ExbB proton channel family protein [Prevotella sp.]|nr:MotA/TolQ/ExbB proton channel family protein [Bacteroides sp.]MCM1366847.1 MotA/TolQ/ExbB proton channel family protein [Prevotella sp.]MCM1437197.1 MotA/TolQ/ExbB proton channel family protein [Prevotella sp.]
MNLISNILYWISTGLLVPVIVLLIFFFIRAIFMIGAFFGQYLQHKKAVVPLNNRIEKLTADSYNEFVSSLPSNPQNLLSMYAKQIVETKDNDAKIELLLSEYELEASKELSTSKLLTKMGPILGLMGTLIPMGPALVGLSTGDIASMAYNMQVAFATTVVGLVVSAIGFITQQVKERWAVQNITMLEYLADITKQTGNQK